MGRRIESAYTEGRKNERARWQGVHKPFHPVRCDAVLVDIRRTLGHAVGSSQASPGRIASLLGQARPAVRGFRYGP